MDRGAEQEGSYGTGVGMVFDGQAHALGIPMFMKEDLVSVIGDENMIQELPEQFTRRIQ